MKIFFCSFILIFMSIDSTTAMKRPLGINEDDQPNLLVLNQIQEPVLEYASRAELVGAPKKVLRLVCKFSYQFCDRDKKWVFTNTNYPSFKEEMHNKGDSKRVLWIETLLANLSGLSFQNSIDNSALDDESEFQEQEWQKKYVFISSIDLEYIMMHVVKLKELDFYNVSSLRVLYLALTLYSHLDFIMTR